MNCPFCGSASSVTETRDSPDGVRRRRVCTSCKRRFTTYEKLGSAALRVEKRDGSSEPFDTDKLVTALRRVTRHRRLRDDALKRAARDIEATLVDAGQRSVRWSDIVVAAVQRLESLDRRSAERLRANYLDDAGELRLDAAPAAEPTQMELPNVQTPAEPADDD